MTQTLLQQRIRAAQKKTAAATSAAQRDKMQDAFNIATDIAKGLVALEKEKGSTFTFTAREDDFGYKIDTNIPLDDIDHVFSNQLPDMRRDRDLSVFIYKIGQVEVDTDKPLTGKQARLTGSYRGATAAKDAVATVAAYAKQKGIVSKL